MPRARKFRPDFFKDERISELSGYARLLFTGFWCYADREGYIAYKPKYIKVKILPYDDVDIVALIRELEAHQFIRFTVKDDEPHIQIIDFAQWCIIERAPLPLKTRKQVLAAGKCAFCGATTNLTVDHIKPYSKGGTHHISNLQCLCLSCNIKKHDKWEGEE